MKNNLTILLCFFCYTIVSGQPRHPDVDNALTRISLNKLEADYPLALASYDVLIEKDPKNESEYWYEKGICYYRMHQDSISEQAFRTGLTKSNLYAGNNLGVGLMLMNTKPDSALIYFRKVIVALKDSLYLMQNVRSDNNNDRRQVLSDALHNTGLLYFQKKSYDSAQHYLFRSMDVNGNTDEHLLATSYMFYQMDHFEKAYSYAKIALELNRYESRSALIMALSLEKQGKLTKAITSIRELIVAQEVALSQWKRGDGKLKLDLMSSYQTKGYKQMQEINAEFYVILSYLHFKKNEKELSAEAYKKSVKLNPDVFYNISNETSYKAFVDEFIKGKLRLPVVPRDYLPVYRNLFSVKGNGTVNGKQ
jgi:tetratricopeptide (TPR) repeat protein